VWKKEIASPAREEIPVKADSSADGLLAEEKSH